MRRVLLLIMVVAGSIAVACKGRLTHDEPLTLKNGGAVQLKLASAPTRSIGTPTADDFTVTFTDQNSEVVFAKPYPELPYVVVLKQGDYQAVAEYGENLPFSTTTPYYRSDKNFQIEIGQTIYIDMQAELHSYIVQINYVSDFAAYFDTYYVEAQVGDTASYVFAQDAPQSAYLAPGSVKLVLKGTLKDGGQYSSIVAQIDGESRKLHACNLKILPKGHLFDLSIDKQVTDVNVNSTVPDEWLPDMPSMAQTVIESYETEDPAGIVGATVTVNSIVAIKDLCFVFDDKLKAELGVTADTLRASSADDLLTLGALGVDFSQGTVIGSRTGEVNFARMASNLKTVGGVATDFALTMVVKDVIGKQTKGDVTLKVKTPEFAMPKVLPGNIWTREFTFTPITADNITHGNHDKMVANGGFAYQYSVDGVDWINIPTGEYRVAGLMQNTPYQLRAVYRGISCTPYTATTEAVLAVPDGGKFENWNLHSYRSEAATIGDGSIWSSRNAMTTGSGADTYACRYSGTYRATGSSGYGAEITTAGWGSGNTWAGTLWAAVVNNISAGSLFLGSYSGGEKHGYSFASRPTSMTFYMAYDPHNGDQMKASIEVQNRTGDVITVLATGVFQSSEGHGDYRKKTIELNYANSNPELAPTHICVAFYSGKNEGSKDYIRDYSKGFYGSHLYVDELTFQYDK